MNETLLQSPSEIHLSYRPRIKPSASPSINSSNDAYRIFLQNWNKDRIEFIEQFKVLFLTRANRAIGILKVSTGGCSGTVSDPKLIFGAALKANASGIIVAHNHPSGNLKPSEADIQLTKKLVAAGKFLEIQVHDHIIVTSEGYFSFADQGMI